MNVAFYYYSDINPNRGGTERVTYVLAKELERRGINYIYIAQITNGVEYEEEKGKQYFLPCSERLACPENEARLHELLKEKKIDVLINQDAMNGLSTFLSTARFPETHLVSVVHFNLFGACEHLEDEIKQNYIQGRISRRKYFIQRLLMPYYKHKARIDKKRHYQVLTSVSDRVVLLSQHDVREYPCSGRDKLCSIPNPVTLGASSPVADKEKLVLFVGRMSYAPKRPDYFLRVWKKIQDVCPDWRAEILGGGPCLAYFEELATKLGVERVRFRGFVDPTEYYRRASVICMTSTYEGFGLVLLEAQKMSCVPIAFDSYGAVRDIVEDGNNGYLVPPFDLDLYAEKLKSLMADHSLRESMANQGAATLRKFAVDKVVPLWLDLLNKIVKQ